MNSLIKKIVNRFKNKFSSTDYWEQRYKAGGNSGSGSYNQLASFKADFINAFIYANKINSAVEFGCGDGNQLSLINYPTYKGLDVSPTSVKICETKFLNDSTKSFQLYNPHTFKSEDFIAHEISLSLDVIYHLVETVLFNLHLTHLFQSASRFVIIYSTNFEEDQINHERNHHFTKWVEENEPNWALISVTENPFKNETDLEKKSLSDFFVFAKKQVN